MMSNLNFLNINIMKAKKTALSFRKDAPLFFMALPAITFLFLFSYLPLFGLIIAFKNLDFTKGIIASDWADPIYNNFIYLFTSSAALRAIKNTIILNSIFIISGIIFEVGFSLLMNDLKVKVFKRVSQSLTLLPYFLSWMVVGVFAYNIFNYDYGSLNILLKFVGLEKVAWYLEPDAWPVILAIVYRWKFTGYQMIIYMASLAGISNSYYEAAEIDGASRWHKIWYISIPMLMPTIITLTLLQIGRIMNADFGMFFALVGDAPMLFPTTDVIDTFVYRSLRQMGNVGMSSAAGFMQSLISFILVLMSNLIAKRINRDSALL